MNAPIGGIYDVTNQDCNKCDYCSLDRTSESDFEEYMYICKKLNTSISHININQKPCKLSPGKFYKAAYKIETNENDTK